MNFYSLCIQVPANRFGDGNIKTCCPKCHNIRHDRHDKFTLRQPSPNTLSIRRVSESVERIPGKDAPEPTVNFNYFLGDRLVNIKYRMPDKTFKMTTGVCLIPYNIMLSAILRDASSQNGKRMPLVSRSADVWML